jgi:hypothetical protein
MNDNIFRDYQEQKENESAIQIIENSDNISIFCSEKNHVKLIEILDDEYFIYEETDSGFLVKDIPYDDFIKVLSEYEFLETLDEAAPVRKLVVRGGKRKVIFKCPPGQKKIKRRCIRRPAAELARVRRGARKAARKARSKRTRANRRRKISLKRRASFAKRRH